MSHRMKSNHDCHKCLFPIKAGHEKEVGDFLYHENCAPAFPERHFMVLIKCGSAKVCWVCEEQPTLEAAVNMLEGIVEAGGNVWDTEDGEPPEEIETHGYETILAVEVTGMSKEQMNALEMAAEVMAA